MKQTTITSAFNSLKAMESAGGRRVVLDMFVFANIPDHDVTTTPPFDATLPDEAHIVYRQPTDNAGMVNADTVAYSVTLAESVGNFTFNWMGLINSESGTLAMVTYLEPQQKIRTASGVQGNVLTYSEVLKFDSASEQTGITTPVSTWQIDFTARLHGMDEAARRMALDIYGPSVFSQTAFNLTSAGNGKATLSPGIAYIRGLRAELDAVATLTYTTGREQTVSLDVVLTGTLTGENKVSFTLINQSLTDYTDSLGFCHYVQPLAHIAADGTITDLRKTVRHADEQLLGDFLSRTAFLKEIADQGGQAQQQSRDHLGLGNSAILDVGTGKSTVAAGDDSRILAAKKAIDDTQTGLPRQPVMWVDSADDLSHLPAGARRFAKNKEGKSVLPTDNYAYIRVVAKRDTDDGGCIQVVDYSDPGLLWTGVRNSVPDDTSWTWVGQYTESHHPPQQTLPDSLIRGNNLSDLTSASEAVDHLGLRDTVSKASHIDGDGDVQGSIWGGGWLSDWINRRFAAKSTASLETDGWFKDASTGLIIQWGIAGGELNRAVIDLPRPFPNRGLWSLGWVSGTLDRGDDDWSNSASLVDNSRIMVTTDHGWSTAWIAIGY
ncbi:phage tail protein [Salmonella enterica]|nr:phage tail protein [Salmonella enterica]HCM4642864.1 phage tail protein [Salmonella enterica subsp. enterica serovar Panama]EJJ3988896.1 phage tail protein [Salmonella enterica]EJJ4038660.1 phage tail protein [Salmonella enterica]EJJ4053005.1 phage tail protein [Salmonella enterica]